MAANRAAAAKKRAAAAGLVLEHEGGGYRLTNAATGTLVAADWSTVDGFGLDLDAIEKAIDCLTV